MGFDIIGANEMLVGFADEEVGYDDDVSGDVDELLSGYEIVGARRRRGGGRGRSALRPSPGRAPIQHGTLLKEQQPSKDGQLVLPMSSSGTIAAATAATITARPQVKAYRPQRIVIAASIASFFTLSDIKVGNVSQFVQAGTIPAEAFIQGAFGVAMRMDTVQTAQDFVFQVNNVDAMVAHTFLCVVFGRSVS